MIRPHNKSPSSQGQIPSSKAKFANAMASGFWSQFFNQLAMLRYSL